MKNDIYVETRHVKYFSDPYCNGKEESPWARFRKF